MKNNESLHMLPRFDSQTTELKKAKQSDSIDYKKIRLLPRFQSDYYDENQSADTDMNEKIFNISSQFLERAYDRSGKKCWPMINTKIRKFDLEYTYEVVGDALASYIHYRKLDRCKALSNFIEYRNKVYKREKIAQYASSEPKLQMKEIDSKSTIHIPTKIIQVEEQDTPSLPPSPSPLSETDPATPISSLQSLISKKSEQLSKPIPSVQSMSPKTSQKLSPSQSINSKPSTPTPSIRSMSSKTSQKLSPSSPVPSLQSMNSKLSPSTPMPSIQSMRPKTSEKLSPSTPVSSSSRSMISEKSQKQSTPIPSSKQSMNPKASQNLLPPKPIPPSRSMSPNTSQKLSPVSTKESIIPIPSPGLLKRPISKQSKINTPKKTNSNIKQTSSSQVKGQS